MSQLERHNPFAFDLDQPDRVNDEGVKWWGVDIGDPQDGHAVYVEFPDGTATYAVLRDGEIVYETGNLEQLIYKFTEYELVRTKRMISVSIAINGEPIFARTAVNRLKETGNYVLDDGSFIEHDPDDGAVVLAIKMLQTIHDDPDEVIRSRREAGDTEVAV